MHQQFHGEGKIESSVLGCPISSWKELEHSQQDSHKGHKESLEKSCNSDFQKQLLWARCLQITTSLNNLVIWSLCLLKYLFYHIEVAVFIIFSAAVFTIWYQFNVGMLWFDTSQMPGTQEIAAVVMETYTERIFSLLAHRNFAAKGEKLKLWTCCESPALFNKRHLTRVSYNKWDVGWEDFSWG